SGLLVVGVFVCSGRMRAISARQIFALLLLMAPLVLGAGRAALLFPAWLCLGAPLLLLGHKLSQSFAGVNAPGAAEVHHKREVRQVGALSGASWHALPATRDR